MSRVIDTNGALYAPLGIYVHIPFCVRKCKYCDFISYAGKSCQDRENFVDEICKEIEEKGREYKEKYYVDTVFFGGGTPTYLDADELIKILQCIDNNFVLGCINARACGAGLKSCDGLEISFEANPGTIDKGKLERLKAAGFNRISIGVQSFNDAVLQSLGRIHSADEAKEAVLLAKALGFNTNIDLMFGVPDQDIQIWEDSLKTAITLNPDHISFYSLQLEENTPLYETYRFGDLSIPEWEANRNMYHFAQDMLKDSGYKHYEISNAAKPGFECRHNMKYWTMADYLGFGPSAHSYIEKKRFFNSVELSGWQVYEDEIAGEKGDYIFTRLRLIDGFPKDEYKEHFGRDFFEEFAGCYDPEMLTEENGMVKLTRKGLDNTNPVMADLINAIIE